MSIIDLSPQLVEINRQKVASGLYQSEGEVLLAALRLLDERDQLRAFQVSELQQAIHDGLNSGSSTPFDPDEFTRTMRARWNGKVLSR